MNNQTKDALLQVTAGIAVSACILMAIAKVDLSAAKENQKVERAIKYLDFAAYTVSEQVKKTGLPYEPAPEQTLPEVVSSDFAKLNGDKPYFQAEGQYARLDFFGGEKPFTAPLRYYVQGASWIIASQGPDLDQDLVVENGFPTKEELSGFLYDPTNGVVSSGDLVLFEYSTHGK